MWERGKQRENEAWEAHWRRHRAQIECFDSQLRIFKSHATPACGGFSPVANRTPSDLGRDHRELELT